MEDWENSHTLDLSDEGLMKDLGEENEDAVARLGIDAAEPAHHHNHGNHDHRHKHDHEHEHKNHRP